MPMRLRNSWSSRSVIARTSRWSMKTLPLSGRMSPVTIFKSTLFPEAPGPMSPYRHPAGTSRSTPRNTGTSKDFLMPSSRIMTSTTPTVFGTSRSRSAQKTISHANESAPRQLTSIAYGHFRGALGQEHLLPFGARPEYPDQAEEQDVEHRCGTHHDPERRHRGSGHGDRSEARQL